MSSRLRRLRPPPRFTAPQVSFTGVRDSLDITTGHARKAFNLQNVYPQDAEFGGGLAGRPGFVVLNETQISGEPAVRHIKSFQQNDGTRYTVAFADDKMYEVNWATGVLTDVTPVGPTIDSSADIFTVFFADQLIVSDGVNKPWAWDGATATVLTDAPIAFGQPVVYFAKLFFIDSVDRTMIQWSEENDPETGYTAGVFNNAWNLIQVANSPLYALAATEEALYYFRAYGIGAVVGSVTPDFASTGVQEAVSSTIGTRSPASVLVLEREIWFLDAQNRPQIIRAGGGLLEDAWKDARETARVVSIIPDDQARSHTVLWPWARLVLFCTISQSALNPDRIIVYDSRRHEFVGVWNGFEFSTAALVEDASGDPILVHGSLDGYIYRHGQPRGTLWSNDFVAGEEAITHVVDGTALGYAIKDESRFTRLDIAFRNLSNITGLELQTRTPYTTQGQTLPDLASGGAVWGDPGTEWGDAVWSSGEAEAHVAVGLNDLGRWLRVRIEHATAGEQFGFLGWQVEGTGHADPPQAQ